MKIARTRGFTLLELLIVIIIMGILAGILLPAFVKTRAIAKQKKVMSDCDTISAAIRNYRFEKGEWPVPSQDQIGTIAPNNPLVFVTNNYEIIEVMDAYNSTLKFLNVGDYSTNSAGCLCDPWGRPYRFIFALGAFRRIEVKVEKQ